MLRGDSGVEQLAAVGFDEIKEDFFGQDIFAVSGSAGGEEEQRIAFVDFVGLFGFVEEIGGVGELRFEAVADFLSDLIAAVVNAGADGSLNVSRLRSEIAAHFSYTFFNDALHGAAPAGVEDTYCMALGVDQDDGEAVGGLDREQKSRGAGDEAIAGKLMGRDADDAVDEVGMNLAQRNQGPRFALGEILDEGCPITFDGAARGIFGESEIARGAGAEGMDEPGELFQRGGLEDGGPGLGWDFGGHENHSNKSAEWRHHRDTERMLRHLVSSVHDREHRV